MKYQRISWRPSAFFDGPAARKNFVLNSNSHNIIMPPKRKRVEEVPQVQKKQKVAVPAVKQVSELEAAFNAKST
jgi:hypothetical protein